MTLRPGQGLGERLVSAAGLVAAAEVVVTAVVHSDPSLHTQQTVGGLRISNRSLDGLQHLASATRRALIASSASLRWCTASRLSG